MALKKEKTETRRDQIVQAALEVIGEGGIQGLTTLSIAKIVGISEANLYRHFENKDAILTAVIEHIDQTLSYNLRTVIDGPSGPVEKLETIFNQHISMIQDNRGIPRIVFSSDTILRTELRDKMHSLINRYLKTLTDILKKGIRGGSIKSDMNAEATAAMFIGMIQISAIRWTFSNFQMSLSGESRKLWQAYKKIIKV
ncbi:MAG: TetR/AcrR family transcriptional regulator [Nitrospirae bacterium]|nr:TetR/AcrR family transcriptional regulator [Nitrospirota bacterium]